MLSGLTPKYTPGGPVLTNLWQPGESFWETRMDELDPTSRVLSGPVAAEEQNSAGFLWHQVLLCHPFWLPCTMSQCWTGCTDSAWTWQPPDGKTRHRIDHIALPEAWKHLQIQACNHPGL